MISGKGGVGKTTTAANLGAALTEFGKDVVVLDANLTAPNLSFHLGIPLYPVTLHDVLKKKANINDAIYNHHSGIKVIPASLSVKALRGLDTDKLHDIVDDLQNEFIIVDAAAGLGKEAQAAIGIADDVIVVTAPEMPAVTDALKTIKIAEQSEINVLGAVINRVKGARHELSSADIKSILEVPILSIIPEDPKVPQSIAMKMPVVHFSPKSVAARKFKKLAADIIGKRYIEPKQKSPFEHIFEQMFGWLVR